MVVRVTWVVLVCLRSVGGGAMLGRQVVGTVVLWGMVVWRVGMGPMIRHRRHLAQVVR